MVARRSPKLEDYNSITRLFLLAEIGRQNVTAGASLDLSYTSISILTSHTENTPYRIDAADLEA
jgi:hypothetical protein